MSSELLSVLLVCNRRIIRQRGKFSNVLIGPHVRHFSDGNQTVCPTLKKNHALPLCQNMNDVYLFYIQYNNVFIITVKFFTLSFVTSAIGYCQD
jgi:hypothetical protein